MNRRVLCLHAHPDDAEILTGGTLVRLAAAGHHLTIVSMTSGDCGSDELGPEETARIRRKEAAQAAALIGAEYHSLGFSDLAIFVDDGSRRRVTAALRRFRPDLILTASPRDYHCDHEATSLLVRDACFGAPAPNYRTAEGKPLPAIPHLYFADAVGGGDERPDIVVDVTAQMETKRALLECHASQRAWLKRQHSIEDYLEQMARWTAARGALAGFAYGEGFRQHRGHPWPATPLLEELLGGGYQRL